MIAKRRVAVLALGVVAWVALALIPRLVAGGRRLGVIDERAVIAAARWSAARPDAVRLLETWAWLTQPGRVYAVAFVIIGWFVWRRRCPARGLVATLTMAIGWPVAAALKQIVHRPRPSLAEPVATAPGFSYPSGHAANLALAVVVVGWVAWPWLPRGGRLAAAAMGASLIAITAAHRVLLGVHYPSDVAAGVLYAAGWLAVLSCLHPARRSAQPSGPRLGEAKAPEGRET